MFASGRDGRADLAGRDFRHRLAELGGLGGGLAVMRDDDVDLRSIDCSKSLRLISARRPRGTLLATTITLACGALDLSQERMRMVSRVAASVSSVTTTATFTSCTRCGYWISMLRGRSITVDLERVPHLFLELEEGGAVGHQRLS